MSGPVSPHFRIGHSDWGVPILTIVLISIFLMANNVEHFFTCLHAVSSSVKCLHVFVSYILQLGEYNFRVAVSSW